MRAKLELAIPYFSRCISYNNRSHTWERRRQKTICYILYWQESYTNIFELHSDGKKEFLVVVYSMNKFHHYITGYLIFLYIDHSTIINLANKLVTNGKLTHWMLLLQEFDIAIKDSSRKENLVTDFF